MKRRSFRPSLTRTSVRMFPLRFCNKQPALEGALKNQSYMWDAWNIYIIRISSSLVLCRRADMGSCSCSVAM